VNYRFRMSTLALCHDLANSGPVAGQTASKSSAPAKMATAKTPGDRPSKGHGRVPQLRRLNGRRNLEIDSFLPTRSTREVNSSTDSARLTMRKPLQRTRRHRSADH
jgi:hypothetical protein